MKSYRFISIFKAIIVAITVFIIVCMGYIIEKSIFNNNGLGEGYTDKYPIQNMEYSFDGENFKDYSDFKNEDKYSKKGDMIIRGTIDSIDINNPVLFIKVKNNYYDIYIDGEKLIERSETNTVKDFTSMDYVSINKNSNQKTVNIFLHSDDSQDIAKGLEVYTSSYIYVISEILIDGSIELVFALVSTILGVLLVFSNFSPRYRKYGFGLIGYITLLMSFLFLLSFSGLLVVFVRNAYILSFFTAIIMYQIPFAILLYTQKFDSNRKHDEVYSSAINIYIMLLFGILLLEALDIIDIQEFYVYISIILIAIDMWSIYVFVDKLRDRNINIGMKDDDKIEGGKDLGKYLPRVFTVFLAINLVGLLFFLINSNHIYYVLSIVLSTILLLTFCGALFFIDINKLNLISINYQERRDLNAMRINCLVEQQSKLFDETKIEDICDKFSSNIKGILFPYNDTHKFSSQEVNEQYLKDYQLFEKASLMVSVIMNNELSGIVEHKVFAATKDYEIYKNKDLQKEMSKDDFGKLLFVMKGIKEQEPENICVCIGDTTSPKGIIMIKDVGVYENTLKGILESYVRTCATLIENLLIIEETKRIQQDTVYNLNEISELRSKETGFHIKRVSLYCTLLGQKMGYSEEDVEVLQLASSMHDIGKINIPDKILNKPGKLTKEEFDIMKTHTEIGFNVLKNTNNDVMKVAAIIAKYHHEKFNGNGYYGLKGKEIPKVARIAAVADVFDALSVERVYKSPWPLEKILNLFKEERNEHFDGEIVDILFDNLDEFIEIRDRYKELD